MHSSYVVTDPKGTVVNEVGNQVRGLVDNAYEAAQKILNDHRAELDKVANTLIEKEKITAEEFEKLFEEQQD